MDSTIIAAVIAAVVELVSPMITLVTEWYEHKKSIDAQFRDYRVELFTEFMDIFDRTLSGVRSETIQKPSDE